MTRFSKTIATFTLALGLSSNALAECTPPTSTPIIPDGNVASLDELLAAKKGFDAYQDGFFVFQECLKASEAALGPDGDLAALKAANIAIEEASLANVQAIGDEFNTAVKAYKSRQPTKAAE